MDKKLKDNFSGAKRIVFITDTHLGVRSNSIEWIEIMEDYFRNWFIPLMRKNYRKGDVLVHLGDVFDSRNSINLRVLNLGISIFEELASIFEDGIVIIPGNHDVYGKFNNDVNSLKSLKWIPNINIYEEPVSMQFGPKKFLLMPWRKDHEAEKECIAAMSPGNNYMLCHMDVQGMKFNKFTTIEDGCTLDSFKGFDQVYSGHIHFSQRVANVYMLGSPYQLTRSDMYNPKGIVMLDLETGQETYFPNDHSPQFIKVKFTDVMEMTPEKLNGIFRNNFVDIYLDGEQALKVPLNLFYDLLDGKYRRIDPHPILLDEGKTQDAIDFGETNFDFLQFVDKYIETLPYEADTKKKIYDFVSKLYHKTEQQLLQSV